MKVWWRGLGVCAFAVSVAACLDFSGAEEACLRDGLCLPEATADAGGGQADGGTTDGGEAPDAGNPSPTVLSVLPTSLQFGGVASGSAASRRVSVMNTGNASLPPPSLELSADPTFSVDALTCQLPLDPQQSCAFEVWFRPTTPGVTSSGSVTVSAAGQSVPVSLTGLATAPGTSYQPTPASVSFPDTVLDATAEVVVTLRNTGQANLSVRKAKLSALSSQDLSLGIDDCDGRVLGASESCTVAVRFTPRREGAAAGTLYLAIDGQADLGVPLSGVGYALAMLEVLLSGETDAGVVSGFDGGLVCGPERCTFIARRGTVGLLEARSLEPMVVFHGLEGAGCGGGNSCTLTLTPDASVVTAEFEAYNLAFATSTTLRGNLSGAAGATAHCRAAAEDAGLRPTGWVAMLSVDGGTVYDGAAVVGASRSGSTDAGWYRLDGIVFALSAGELVSKRVVSPVLLDERGRRLLDTDQVWTGAYTLDCNGWTSSSTLSRGQVGLVSSERSAFEYNSDDCASLHHLLCVSTSSSLRLEMAPIPPGGKLAFVSAAKVVAAGALAVGDEACNREARSDGGFVALLPPMAGTPAVSRLRLDAGTWFRSDGVRLFGEATDLAAVTARQLVPLNRQVDGGLAVGMAWTGDVLPSRVASSLNSCSYWAADAGSGRRGDPGRIDGFTGGGSTNCTAALSVYCFER